MQLNRLTIHTCLGNLINTFSDSALPIYPSFWNKFEDCLRNRDELVFVLFFKMYGMIIMPFNGT